MRLHHAATMIAAGRGTDSSDQVNRTAGLQRLSCRLGTRIGRTGTRLVLTRATCASSGKLIARRGLKQKIAAGSTLP